jgi:hypothetical protein
MLRSYYVSLIVTSNPNKTLKTKMYFYDRNQVTLILGNFIQ